jgi:CDP-diacylglycerol--glycerol-3-phosphate 3-phosphatidyltransferase
MLNVPNLITLSRIILIPLIIGIYYLPYDWLSEHGKNMTATVVFILAAATDWLDGYLARRRKQVTPLGQFMDPLADKLLITAALVSLVQMDLAQSWMVVVILGREIAVTVLRSVAQSRGVSIPASPLGKFKMASEVTAVLLLILGEDVPVFAALGTVALWVALVTALASAWDYYRRYNGVISAV